MSEGGQTTQQYCAGEMVASRSPEWRLAIQGAFALLHFCLMDLHHHCPSFALSASRGWLTLGTSVSRLKAYFLNIPEGYKDSCIDLFPNLPKLASKR